MNAGRNSKAETTAPIARNRRLALNRFPRRMSSSFGRGVKRVSGLAPQRGRSQSRSKRQTPGYCWRKSTFLPHGNGSSVSSWIRREFEWGTGSKTNLGLRLQAGKGARFAHAARTTPEVETGAAGSLPKRSGYLRLPRRRTVRENFPGTRFPSRPPLLRLCSPNHQ